MTLSEAVAEYEDLGTELVRLQEELDVAKRRQGVLSKQVFSAVSAGTEASKGEYEFQVAGGKQYRVHNQKIEPINEVEVLSQDLRIGD